MATDNMRVRVLILFSTGHLGGAERSLTRMAEVNSGVDYELATIGTGQSWADFMKTVNREPLFCGSDRSTVSTMRGLWSKFRAVRRGGFDVVYAVGNRASLFAWLALLGEKTTKVVHAIRWSPSGTSISALVTRGLHRYIAGRTYCWISNSNAAARCLEATLPTRSRDFFVIPNGVNLPAQTVSAPSTRQDLVLTVANIQERKGLLEYVDEVREIVASLPNTRFVFLGADRMNGLLQETITEAGLSRFMSVQGFVEDVEPWLLQAKVVVLPSRYGEGAPTSLLEAMACGTPVVAFNIDGISDIVRHQVDGLVGPLEDGWLSNSLLRLLTDPETLDRMSSNGISRVRNDFTVTRCAQEHAKVFLAAAGPGLISGND